MNIRAIQIKNVGMGGGWNIIGGNGVRKFEVWKEGPKMLNRQERGPEKWKQGGGEGGEGQIFPSLHFKWNSPKLKLAGKTKWQNECIAPPGSGVVHHAIYTE